MTVNDLKKLKEKDFDTNCYNMIIEYVLQMDRKQILLDFNKKVSKSQENKIRDLINKVKNGFPVQYAINKAYFMNLEFYVNENVLIPQPDTEILVEKAIEEIKKMQRVVKHKIKILDLCTGSGCIALSIANSVKNVKIYATDISTKALNIAKKNYKRLEKYTNGNEVYFKKSDMFNNIKEKDFDFIITNPPYIEANTINTLSKEVKSEPKIALDGGKDGLKFYKIIRENIDNYLRKDGMLFMEIGYNQAKSVQDLFKESEVFKDFGNNDRVIKWTKK